jgi:hypothetical protein
MAKKEGVSHQFSTEKSGLLTLCNVEEVGWCQPPIQHEGIRFTYRLQRAKDASISRQSSKGGFRFTYSLQRRRTVVLAIDLTQGLSSLTEGL